MAVKQRAYTVSFLMQFPILVCSLLNIAAQRSKSTVKNSRQVRIPDDTMVWFSRWTSPFGIAHVRFSDYHYEAWVQAAHTFGIPIQSPTRE